MNILYEILVATVFSLLLSPHEKLKKTAALHKDTAKVYLEGRTGIWYNLKKNRCNEKARISRVNNSTSCCML